MGNSLIDSTAPQEVKEILSNEVIPRALKAEGFQESDETSILLGCCRQNAYTAASVFEDNGYTTRLAFGALDLNLGENPETYSEVCELGHNHVWAEVKINNNWYIVEPCADINDRELSGGPLLSNSLHQYYLFETIDSAFKLTSLPKNADKLQKYMNKSTLPESIT